MRVSEHLRPLFAFCVVLASSHLPLYGDERPRLVIVSAEDEYKTETTLPEFAKKHLDKLFQVSYVFGDPADRNNLKGIEVLRDADLALFSIRRRTPPKEQLDVVRQYLKAGKPLVAIRTVSHAFSPLPGESVPAGHDAWPTFDRDVLGCHYEGHYPNNDPAAPRTIIWANKDAATKPILAGVNADKRAVTSWLYKSHELSDKATVLLWGSVGDKPPTEPVAWTTNSSLGGGKVFYTMLGHPDEFATADFQQLLLNAICWAGGVIAPVVTVDESKPPFSPKKSLSMLKVPDDLEIDEVLAEPTIAQPVFINFDERERMWVVEYLQYPYPAGLKMLSRDNVWRAVYDKIPPPPPNHIRGADKITIHEDTDGDGTFDKHSTFLDGLNIVTSVCRGRGGVWVLNPPYLLFYTDKNNDDVPDGDPKVHLSGFGLEDTHSVANSLCWGPDGWLYAAQGSTVSGDIIRPGLDKQPVHSMGQLIWRYHPETRRYEIFAEGGGNAFGCEIDSKGRVFSGHNGGDTRGFHYVQGGYLQKGFGKHGPLSNPFAFGYFLQMKHATVPRFTHEFVIYEGGALPAHYEGKLFGVAPLLSYLVESEISPERSSFQTQDISFPITSTDPWFRPVDVKFGPDGALYIADWYDGQVNHYRNHEGQIDKTNGRIYRLRAKEAKPAVSVDLAKLSTAELLGKLTDKNRWVRFTSLRLLGDRRDPAAIPLAQQLLEQNEGQLALDALWALNLSGGLDEAAALKALDHKDPFVRQWTARLLCDEKKVSEPVLQKLLAIARVEPDIAARSQLACSARRLSAAQCLPLVRRLLEHSEDVGDIHIPLLLWWAVESKADSDRTAVLAMFEDPAVWSLPLTEQKILPSLMRRYAQAGTRKDLLTCAQLLQLAPTPQAKKQLMSGFEEAFNGRSLAGLPSELVEQLAKAGGVSLMLRVRQGDAAGIEEALKRITDETLPQPERLALVQVFGEVKQSDCVPVLLAIAGKSSDEAVKMSAITALQSYNDDTIGKSVVAMHDAFSENVRAVAQTLLASRVSWSHEFLDAVAAGKIGANAVPLPIVRKVLLHSDPALAEQAHAIWGEIQGATTDQMRAEIARLASVVRSGSGNPYEGKKLFVQTCAKCHTLFTEGGKIGPELTAYKRDDVDTILLNIVNPSAEIREGFENYAVLTDDGRVLNGFLADQDNKVVVLRGADGQNVTIERDHLDELRKMPISLMPEDLLKSLSDQQVRDLFAYLRSTQPQVSVPRVLPWTKLEAGQIALAELSIDASGHGHLKCR